jgi:hypothetical protein
VIGSRRCCKEPWWTTCNKLVHLEQDTNNFWPYLLLIWFCLHAIRSLLIQKMYCHPLEEVKDWRAKAAEIFVGRGLDSRHIVVSCM